MKVRDATRGLTETVLLWRLPRAGEGGGLQIRHIGIIDCNVPRPRAGGRWCEGNVDGELEP